MSPEAVKRWLVFADPHVPYVNAPAWNCTMKAIGIVKPHGVVCLGDFAECASVSHWQWKNKRKPPLDYQLADAGPEIIIINEWADKLDKVMKRAKVKEMIFSEGNHENWFNAFVEGHPHLAQTKHAFGNGYLFKDIIGAKRRGWQYIPVGKRFKLGKLYLYHGHLYKGIHHAKNHLNKLGVSVMYGHHHDIQQHDVTHEDGPKSAWSIGCLKSFEHEMANEFMNRGPMNWGHAFATVDVYGCGMFTVNVTRIINGQCSLWGKVIDGNE